MSPEAPAVVVRDLWFAYRHHQWVLQALDMTVARGSFVALLGSSGAGKTTLLKLLAGFLPPSRGAIEVFGHPFRGSLPRALRGRIGYIPQQLGLVRSLTALENVLLGTLARHTGPLAFLGLFPKEEVEQAQALLASLGLADKAHEKVLHLSGGQRQRVAIARTLLQRPQLVLADEFVSDLDFPMAMELLETVRESARRDGITYIMALHEVPLVQSFADEAFVLRDGRIVHHGPGPALTFSALTELLV
jgi:phosphonate transport system ATP-binding protein